MTKLQTLLDMRQSTQDMTVLKKLRHKIELAQLVFSLLSAAAFTVFTLIMLYKDWGKSVYLYIVLGFIISYIAVFVGLILFIYLKKGKLGTSLKNYKSGLKILKAVLRLISLSITVSVLSIAVLSDANAVFRFLVLLSSVIWAVFQIFYQLYKLFKRHKKSRPELQKKGLRAKRLRKAPVFKKRK